MALPQPAPSGTGFGRAVTWAALVAGGLFLILVIVLPAVFAGGMALGPPRMIGALVVGQDPLAVTSGVIVTGVLAHFLLSFIFTYILALIVYRLGTGAAVAVGTVYGLALYLLNFYGMAVAFPWFAEFRNPTTFLSHLAFGFTAAWVYKYLKRPSEAPAERNPNPATWQGEL